MRFTVRIDRLARKADAFRERLRAAVIVAASSGEPALRGLPSSSLLRSELLSRLPSVAHDRERAR